MKIKITLSSDGLEQAAEKVEEYRQLLIDKTARFTQQLAEIGIPVVNANMSSTVGDYDASYYTTRVEMQSFQTYQKATLYLEGEGVLFIEFGAGIHYNGAVGSSPHPKGVEFGYTIGSYGKGNGARDSWRYRADSGEIVKTHGTQASMPMYKASQKIITEVARIASEVFGS